MMQPKWFWILVTVLFIEGWCETKGCLENERIALLQLKSFFNRPYSLHNWVYAKGSDCCQWKRVECSIGSRRVIGLSLNAIRHWSRGSNWYLNASLFLPFQELKSLYLNDNQIAGCVDKQGFAKLSSVLSNLEILDLSRNYFNDSILSSLTELSSLKSLNLAHNQFTGESNKKNGNGFKWLSRFTNLETLDLTENHVKNNFLLHVGGLSSLKTLKLGFNQLKGSIGIEELNNLTNLKSLDLSANEIEIFQPCQDHKRQLTIINLEELDLSDNLLDNSIWAYLSGLSNLKSLNIGNNQLQGSVDFKEMNKWTKLKKLDISLNAIKMSLRSFQDALNNLEELDITGIELHELVTPKENGSLRKLNVVKADGLIIDGSVSLLQVVGAFPSAKNLSLRFNYLNKTISTQEALHVSSNVEELYLDYSSLSNNFLQSIGALTSLKTLLLSNCGLTNSLPTKGWCDLKNLKELDLNENALEGTFPPCLDNLTSLRFLDISNNHFEIPASFMSFANHSNLKFLFINQNNLVRQPTFQTWAPTPKFQLKVLGMSNCTTKELPKELPNFLYYQHDLRFLEISFNKFGGEIPTWLLENNTRLQQLLMSSNSFEGTLQLPARPNLNMFEIDLSNNKIQGQIQTSICSIFPNLNKLSLSNNAFEGNIPPCLGGLKFLSTLDLSYNNFSGGTLEELAKSNSLDTIRLSNNNLTGKIVPTLFSSNILSKLYLDGNNFDGEIPGVEIPVGNLSLLTDIDLSNNHLSGKLPRWLWNVSGLQILAFSNNHLDGFIPFELCNLDWLEFLDFSQNNLSGPIPSCSHPLSIRHVHLNGNKLSGPLPRSLLDSSSLVALHLSQNNLNGKIPHWIGTFTALSILILKANQFEGEIPSQLCKLDSLSIIDLSQNKLFGHIPPCLSNLTLEPKTEMSFWRGRYSFTIGALEDQGFYSRDSGHFYTNRYVDDQVEFGTKKGLYSYGGNILDYMSGIDLSCNRLTGQIPVGMGNLSEIRCLNLSHNNLTGHIPSAFSKLKQIESLDLSYNNLSGRIPIQLTELNALAVFNVSYNNLSGSIPYQKAQFGTFDESSYVGNIFLCGPPLQKNCTQSDSPHRVPNASDGEEESSLVDKYVFYVTFLVSYAVVLAGIAATLYINPYWRQAWFYFVEQCISTCYIFILDNLVDLSIFRRRT